MSQRPFDFLIRNTTLLNAFWAVLSKLVSGLKLVIIGVIIARFLGPEKFGAYSYCISFVTLLAVLAEFRLHNILIRELSAKKDKANILLGSAFQSCLFFSLIGYLVLLVLVRIVETDDSLIYLILIYGTTYFFQTLRFLRAFFISKFKNNLIFRVEIISAICILVVGLILGLSQSSLMSFILLMLADVILISILLLLFYNLKYKGLKNWIFDKSTSLGLIKSSSPLVVSSLAMVIFQQFDKIMLKQFLNEYSVGQYSAATSLISLIVFIPVVLTEILSPYLIELKLNSGIKLYQKNAQLFSDYIIWGTILLCAAVMLLSPQIIRIVYGEQFEDAIKVMQIFSWQGGLIAMGAVAAQIMIIDNLHQLAYIKSLLGGLLNIILNIVWIPKFGIFGAVWASLIAYAVSSYLAHIVIKRYQYIFKIQTKSITHGLFNILNDLKARNREGND